MTIQIQLPPETEARLRERAAAEGKDPSALALEALQEKLGLHNGSHGSSSAEHRGVAWNKFVTSTRAWARKLPPGHQVDDSRESIYEGRGE